MNSQRIIPGPLLIPPRDNNVEFEQPSVVNTGSLTPNLQLNTPQTLGGNAQPISLIGKYLLLDKLEPSGTIQMQRAINRVSQEELVCKVIIFYHFIQIREGRHRIVPVFANVYVFLS